jgi:hypothetical protein
MKCKCIRCFLISSYIESSQKKKKTINDPISSETIEENIDCPDKI